MTKNLSRILVPLFGVALFVVMLWVLSEELSTHTWHDISRQMQKTTWQHLAMAVGLTVLSYALLPAYDFLGLWFLGRRVATGRVLLVSLLSYVFSNNVGFLGLSGGAVRLRHYTGRGLGADEVLKLTGFTTGTFWLGLLTAAGLMFVWAPPPPLTPPLPPRAPLVHAAAAVGLLGSPAAQGPLLEAATPHLDRSSFGPEFGAAATIGLLDSPYAQGPLLTAATLPVDRTPSSPPPPPPVDPTPPLLPVLLASMLPLGGLFLGLVLAYTLATLLARRSLRLWKWKPTFPSFPMALGQLAVGSLDWLLAAAALYVLIPEVKGHPLSFSAFFSIFLLAQVIGLLSHVPGGLGVFEGVMVLMLKPLGVAPDTALGLLLVYRFVYYLLPLIVGAGAMGVYELIVHRERVGLVFHLLVPDLLAFLAFVGGVVLVFTGSAPALRQFWWLGVLVPLPLSELPPFVASLAGIALILLARGLQRRFDGAYWLTAALLACGIVASLLRGWNPVEARQIFSDASHLQGLATSLLKGWDSGETCVLAVFLAALLPCRREFYRRAFLFSDRFRLTWISGVAVVILAVGLLTLFLYLDQKDIRETLPEFELSASAPALYRVTVAICVLGLMIVGRQLLQPSRSRHPSPDDAEVAEAGGLAERSPSTHAYLALLGDKSLLFNEKRTGFVMYSVSGGSWIAMGDPVGPPETVAELARGLHERCDRAGGQTVFYQVHPRNLHVYVDMGLSLIKIGEEGRVPLKGFSLTGRARKNMRHMLNKARDAGYSFRMAPAADVAALMPQLRAISDAWLASRNLHEKGFSLGFFDETYLGRFPIALVEQNGKIVAFANLWPGGDRAELSIDLMRHVPDASNGVMDMLFIDLMLWGAGEGYQWFNLGMAPLSGLNDDLLAPLWSRFGGMLYQHGENFYNFQGLRHFKEKFDPVWESRYLASPGGLALPRILAEVTTLIRRGMKGRKESKAEAAKGAVPGGASGANGSSPVLPAAPAPQQDGAAVQPALGGSA